MTEAEVTEVEAVYCVNHPNTETLLRCNRCGKPICMKCARLTDVGYRCKDCIRSQQQVYFNAQSWDNPIAFAVSFVVAMIATPIVGTVFAIAGFFGWLFAFLAGPSAGGLLTQIIRWAVDRRRGRYLSLFAIAGIILGMLVGVFAGAFFGIGRGISLLPLLIFAFLATSTTYRFLR